MGQGPRHGVHIKLRLEQREESGQGPRAPPPGTADHRLHRDPVTPSRGCPKQRS